MTQPLELKVSSPDVLPSAARSLISFSEGIKVWLFRGEMGAGKTTFIRAICHEMGVTDNVTSPTFSLVNEYVDKAGNAVYHFDFYRIEDEAEAWDIGTEEYFESGELCLVEWPGLVPNLLPNRQVAIDLTLDGEQGRLLKFTRHD